MAQTRKSRRNRRSTRRNRRIYGGAWYDPRTWGAKSTPIDSNNLVQVEPKTAPRSTMSALLAPTLGLRFSKKNSVMPIPKLGSLPVGNAGKTRTTALRPNIATNFLKPYSQTPRDARLLSRRSNLLRGNEDALVARHVAELFQRSNSKENMMKYFDNLKVAPHVKNRIEESFMRQYGFLLNNNNTNSVGSNNNNPNNNNPTRRRNNGAAAAYGIASSIPFLW